VPTGITLNSAGLFSGSPTTVGNYTVVATVSDTGGLTNSKTFTWEVKNAPVPNPPTIVTVTTVAYELNKRGGVGSAVGYVALNTPCLGTAPLISKSGKTYYEVSLADVELSKMPKSVIVVGVCAAV
jgi:PKD repeat protein